jgi:polysaccharide biosynthesis protein PslH
MQVLMLSPEPPYPLNGGGAYRTASLLHYFARFAEVDLILISQSGVPALLPPGLVRSQQVIPLARHSVGTFARYVRNARRAALGVPPLIDRLSGLEGRIEAAVGDRHYDLCVIEHFWCAPYVDVLSRRSTRILLDLHNVESVLHARCGTFSGNAEKTPAEESSGQAKTGVGRPDREKESGGGLGDFARHGVVKSVGERLIRAGHRRFARVSRKLEARFLPLYSSILATSEADAQIIREIAPQAKVFVYPNALPLAPVPDIHEAPVLVFSANFEYDPNIDAVAFLIGEIWPRIRQLQPQLRLRLVGRGDAFIRHLLPPGAPTETGIEMTGPIEDARSEIARATLVVAPLRAGSGTRIKILEAWAAQRCVVATPLAAEGLDARDGFNIALETSPEGFAGRVAALATDATMRQRIAGNGRRTFENVYCWDVVWRNLDFDLQLTRESRLNGYTGIS